MKFSWSVNGKKIKGAKGKALKLTKALKGKKVKVKVVIKAPARPRS